MREFEIFAPHMKVIKYHGSLKEREQVQDEMQNYLPGRRHYPQGYLDALLVPVTYYQKEKSDDRRFINKFQFDYLVVDEAHMLKNSLSTRYKMLNKVKTQHRLLLTGTPVQNSPQELLNMLCFIMPLFSKGSESLEYDDADGDRNGTSSVVDRMLQHFVDTEQQKCGDEQVAYAKLKQLFAPFVLRRKKEDVIAQLLPPKKRVVEYVELDPAGRTIYNSILEDHINKSGTKVATVAVGEHLFTNLRKAAHHPLLLRTRHNTPPEVDHLVTYFHKYQAFAGEASTKAKVGEELAKYNDFEIHLTAIDLVDQNPHRRPDLERYILDESALFSSAKFCRLRTLLPDLIHTHGHRVLIFSGWTSCLDLLGCLMEHLGLEYLRMDGSCPSDIRQSRIDEFNSNPTIPVFLLSTRACGLGINLTAADTCIMHDLDFNPFNDLQAEGTMTCDGGSCPRWIEFF
jgi:SWI/SNF-related matrix-associated actin-dependent regulator 1 of chromatin subfamily A